MLEVFSLEVEDYFSLFPVQMAFNDINSGVLFVNDHRIWSRNSLNYHQWWWTLAETCNIKLDTSQYFMDCIQVARNQSMVCQTKCWVLLDIFDIDRVFTKTDVQPIFPSFWSILLNSHRNSSQFYSSWTLCLVTNNLSAELAGHIWQNVKNFLSTLDLELFRNLVN